MSAKKLSFCYDHRSDSCFVVMTPTLNLMDISIKNIMPYFGGRQLKQIKGGGVINHVQSRILG